MSELKDALLKALKELKPEELQEVFSTLVPKENDFEEIPAGRRSIKQKNRPNKFSGYKPTTAEKVEIDKGKELDNIKEQRIRTTRPSSLIKVKCRSCAEIFKVSKALVRDPKRFKCNSCIVSGR